MLNPICPLVHVHSSSKQGRHGSSSEALHDINLIPFFGRSRISGVSRGTRLLITYIHTYLHTYIPTYLHTYIPTCVYTHIYKYTDGARERLWILRRHRQPESSTIHTTRMPSQIPLSPERLLLWGVRPSYLITYLRWQHDTCVYIYM